MCAPLIYASPAGAGLCVYKMIKQRWTAPAPAPARPTLRRVLRQARTVFQSDSATGNDLSIDDINDCLCATQGLEMRDKRDYFESHGIDYEKVVKYYDVVVGLNRAFDYRTGRKGGNVGRRHWRASSCALAIARAKNFAMTLLFVTQFIACILMDIEVPRRAIFIHTSGNRI